MISDKFKKINIYIDLKVNEKKIIEQTLNDKTQYLKDGIYYILNAEKTIIYLDDDSSNNFIVNSNMQLNRKSHLIWYKYIKDSLKKIVNYLIGYKRKYTVKTKKTSYFEGTLVLLTGTKDIKIFDFKNELVINFIENKEKYKAIKYIFLNLDSYFKLTISSIDDHEKSYVEKYVDFIPYLKLDESERAKTIDLLFIQYIEYYKAHSENLIENITLNDLFNEFKAKLNNHKIINTIENAIDKACAWELSIPIIYSHGDLNFNNLLITKDEVFLIDWEYSGLHTFIYDLINLMYVEDIFHGENIFYMRKYYRGEYDIQLDELFKALNVSYKKELKHIYLIVYIMERISAFETEVNSFNLNSRLESYYENLTKWC